MKYDVIIDCYTDEPSGLGVPPFLSVHSRYIAGALENLKIKYYYLNIDDLRYANEEKNYENSYNKRIINRTKNCDNVKSIIANAKNLYVVMGCFVKYEYVSAEPPTFTEVEELLNKYSNGDTKKVLFYALGGNSLTRQVVKQTIPKNTFDEVVFGNTYNYFIDKNKNSFLPNYDKLSKISVASSSILNQLNRPLVIEIETATGCNRNPGCTFCIEGMRGLPLQFRDRKDIVEEIKALYDCGALFFRLGRQPNFYAYKDCNPVEIEKLFKDIWENCPNIKTLHIDNVSPHNVNTKEGEKITEIIAKYTTDGNITPFGIESFDPVIREKCNLNLINTNDYFEYGIKKLKEYIKQNYKEEYGDIVISCTNLPTVSFIDDLSRELNIKIASSNSALFNLIKKELE